MKLVLVALLALQSPARADGDGYGDAPTAASCSDYGSGHPSPHPPDRP